MFIDLLWARDLLKDIKSVMIVFSMHKLVEIENMYGYQYVIVLIISYPIND